MTDYIDRSKAIEAIEAINVIYDGDGIEQSIDALRDLPSVEVTDDMVERAKRHIVTQRRDGSPETVHWSDEAIRAALAAALGV